MKELSIEEKAKRYDDAIERAKNHHDNDGLTLEQYETIDIIFPELKESKDERIRKALISILKSDFEKDTTIYDISVGDIIAWLEKQGYANKEYWRGYNEGKQCILDKYAEIEKQDKQKPADNIEPKFHEGDWVVYKCDICQIVKREEGCNKLVTNFGIEKELVNERNLSTARLWTIQDAKDGDVLVTDNGLIFIYNGYLEEQQWPFAYGGINIYGKFNICDGALPFTHQKVVPATKEQCDTLMKAMTNAGYTFDFEKKELVL